MAINIKALRDQRAAKATEARNLLDNRTGTDFTKDVETQIDALYEEIDRIDAQIARAEKQAKVDGDAATIEEEGERRRRHNAGLSPEHRAQVETYDAAFRSWMVRGERGLTTDEANALRQGRPQAAQSGQQTNGSQGGYLVPTGWGGELLEALASFGGMRDAAMVMQTASGNPIPWPTVDETTVKGELVAENVAASAAGFTFGTTQIGAYKFSSKIVTIPFELLMDQGPGVDIEAFTRRALATRIARITNDLFTTGTGMAQPQGMITGAAVGVTGATGTTTQINPDSMIDLEHSVDPAYRAMPGVGYMFHDTTLRNIKKLKDGQGNYLWKPGFNSKDPDTINNYPYKINQSMAPMAANAKSIAFGDFKQYMIRDIMEVTLFRFDDSAFITNGQIGFLAWSRHDGRLISAGQPIKVYQHSAS